jgi:hypothetical protein
MSAAASNATADSNLSWFAKNVSEPLKIRYDPQARSAEKIVRLLLPNFLLSAFANRKPSQLRKPPSASPLEQP